MARAQRSSDWLQDCLIPVLICATACISCMLFSCTVGQQPPTAVDRPSGSGLSLQPWCNHALPLHSYRHSERFSSQSHLFGSTCPRTSSTQFLAAAQETCFTLAVVRRGGSAPVVRRGGHIAERLRRGSVSPRARLAFPGRGTGEAQSLQTSIIPGGYKNREEFSIKGWLKKSEYITKYGSEEKQVKQTSHFIFVSLSVNPFPIVW